MPLPRPVTCCQERLRSVWHSASSSMVAVIRGEVSPKRPLSAAGCCWKCCAQPPVLGTGRPACPL